MQRHNRLRRGSDFARLRENGRAFNSRWVLVSIIPNGLPHNRYGFITSKQLGNAITRNRLRRLLREAVRLLHPQLRPGYDVVLIARKSLVKEPFHAVQRIVKELLHQADVIGIESDEP